MATGNGAVALTTSSTATRNRVNSWMQSTANGVTSRRKSCCTITKPDVWYLNFPFWNEISLQMKRKKQQQNNQKKNTCWIIEIFFNNRNAKAVKNFMRTECKCHGLSGSCTLRTCWRKLPLFRDVATRLKEKFDGAAKVIPGDSIFPRPSLSYLFLDFFFHTCLRDPSQYFHVIQYFSVLTSSLKVYLTGGWWWW